MVINLQRRVSDVGIHSSGVPVTGTEKPTVINMNADSLFKRHRLGDAGKKQKEVDDFGAPSFVGAVIGRQQDQAGNFLFVPARKIHRQNRP